MEWTSLTARNAGDAILASDQQAVVNNLNELRGDWAISRYTTADRNLNSTTWADVNGPADLILAAGAGDVIQVSISSLVNNESIELCLDVHTIVSSAAVNSIGTGTTVSNSSRGVAGWQRPAGTQAHFTGTFFYKLVSGDISNSTVTLRLRYRTLTAGIRTMFAAADYPITFSAINHGPVEV